MILGAHLRGILPQGFLCLRLVSAEDWGRESLGADPQWELYFWNFASLLARKGPLGRLGARKVTGFIFVVAVYLLQATLACHLWW